MSSWLALGATPNVSYGLAISLTFEIRAARLRVQHAQTTPLVLTCSIVEHSCLQEGSQDDGNPADTSRRRLAAESAAAARACGYADGLWIDACPRASLPGRALARAGCSRRGGRQGRDDRGRARQSSARHGDRFPPRKSRCAGPDDGWR